MVIIMGLSILVAMSATNVIDIAVFMLGLSSAELSANWGQWWWWRFNGAARLAASFGGPLVFLFNKYIVFSLWIDAGQDTAYVVVLSSIAVTCLLWICVALLTKPEPEDKLITFYRQARPMGWWGPIANKAGVEASSGFGPIAKGLVIATVGATAVGSLIIAITGLYIGRTEVLMWGSSVALILGLLFRSNYTNYMKSVNR